MQCKDCEYFKITETPDGINWGRATCTKYDLVTDFRNKRKINRLTCIEDTAHQESEEY